MKKIRLRKDKDRSHNGKLSFEKKFEMTLKLREAVKYFRKFN
ncbi:MAG: hypothetical protein ACUVWP_02010 [bacterium]